MTKSFDKQAIAQIGVIVLATVGSFGLGRLSVAQQYTREDSVSIVVPELEDLTLDTSKFAFVASKSGTRYYPKTCKAANRIKDENKVYFETKAEAEESGLTPATGC